MNKIFGIFFILIFLLLLSIIIMGGLKFSRTTMLSEVDVISFQISLLEIIITVVTLGGGILAFVGWKELKESVEKKAEEKAEKIAIDKTEILKKELLKNTKIEPDDVAIKKSDNVLER